MPLLIALVFGLLAVSFFLRSAVLNLLTKLFKLQNPSYKKALAATGLEWIATTLIGLGLFGLFYVIQSGESVLNLVGWILNFAVFYFILKKFYQSALGKNIAIYLILGLATAIISAVLILLFRGFVVKPFYMSGNTMEPTARRGQYMLFTMFNDNFTKGDVVALKSPATNKYLIRKVFGMPGEKIQLPSGQDVLLNEQQYFVIAENQTAEAEDSYDFGPVNASEIVGKHWFSLDWFDNPSSLSPQSDR